MSYIKRISELKVGDVVYAMGTLLRGYSKYKVLEIQANTGVGENGTFKLKLDRVFSCERLGLVQDEYPRYKTDDHIEVFTKQRDEYLGSLFCNMLFRSLQDAVDFMIQTKKNEIIELSYTTQKHWKEIEEFQNLLKMETTSNSLQDLLKRSIK